MALTRCYDCRAAISEYANQCPNCGTHFTKGVRCTICGELMVASDSVDIFGSSLKLHRHCGAHLFRRKGQCRECGHTLWGKWHTDWNQELGSFSSKSDKCPTCGVPNPLNYLGCCTTCHLEVYGQIHE